MVWQYRLALLYPLIKSFLTFSEEAAPESAWPGCGTSGEAWGCGGMGGVMRCAQTRVRHGI